MDMIQQNFARSNPTKLEDINKLLTINNRIYHLRGTINLFSGERSGLRAPTGHYTANALRINGKWETYDDMKVKVYNTNISVNTDVEFLIYTV